MKESIFLPLLLSAIISIYSLAAHAQSLDYDDYGGKKLAGMIDDKLIGISGKSEPKRILLEIDTDRGGDIVVETFNGGIKRYTVDIGLSSRDDVMEIYALNNEVQMVKFFSRRFLLTENNGFDFTKPKVAPGELKFYFSKNKIVYFTLDGNLASIDRSRERLYPDRVQLLASEIISIGGRNAKKAKLLDYSLILGVSESDVK